MLLPTVRLQWLRSLYLPRVTYCTIKHLRVTTLDPYAFPRPPTPRTKLQSSYCDTCNRSFLCDKCYQNPLTLTAKSKSVCECRAVCRNCSLLWLQILSLNVSRHSAVSVTISSRRSVFATSLRSSLASFHPDLCSFNLIRNVCKILNCVINISNSTEQYMCWANVFKVWSKCELEYGSFTCDKRVHIFLQDHVG